MDDLSGIRSILPFLPISLSSTPSSPHLTWPEEAERSLCDLTKGPTVSHVDSGSKFFDFIDNVRNELDFSSQPPLAYATSNGLSFFFDQHLSRDEAKVWFDEVVPSLAALLLRLPSLLEAHYCKSNKLVAIDKFKLRLLGSQEAGIVILNRELIAALLACAFFCLFPTKDRVATHLSRVNFDELFATLINGRRQFQHQKMKCFVHYFQRICKDILVPKGVISFERKVLPPCYDANFWNNSDTILCHMQIFASGSIEDQPHEALEIVFSNKYYGLNSISMGCVQEQIRFLTTPELVVGLLFIACMEENEAIEVVGVERYSQYTGYASSFRFAGEYLDTKPVDLIGRRKRRIVAMDALNKPLEVQYETKFLLREVNKAFVGFMESKYKSNFADSQECKSSSMNSDANANVGIATGNWGCGIFGGDPQIKCMIQWMAASQVIAWIANQNWNVSDLWNKVMDYTSQKLEGQTALDFFSWLQSECTNIIHVGPDPLSGSK
ncbi:poly(ADP-ribose) glycohydrolase 1-like isoform X2 [Carex rostrata]